jgi:hypothetical protein
MHFLGLWETGLSGESARVIAELIAAKPPTTLDLAQNRLDPAAMAQIVATVGVHHAAGSW